MQKLLDPNARDINIISTDDPSFTYSVFGDRVSNNEITLKHEAPNSVLFTMTNLLASDEGEYECSVINEEGTYNGVYYAKIILKGNIVFEPRPRSLIYIESTKYMIYIELELRIYSPSL